MSKQENKALLFAGATPGLNNHLMLASTPATEEFRHSSPALIISSANKSRGVEKYLNLTSAGNCQSQTSDLQIFEMVRKAQIRKIVIGTSVTMKLGAK